MSHVTVRVRMTREASPYLTKPTRGSGSCGRG